MTHAIRPQPGIEEIVLYKGGASRLDGRADALKLNANENPFGAPESAKTAFRRAASNLHRYPSSDHADLRAAIAEVHGLNADQIICGAGSDEIIAFLCQAYAGPGTEVIHTEHGFSMYRIAALAASACPVEVAERERVVDVEEILEGITPATRIVFLTNPGNPTGTIVDDSEIALLADALPENVLLVLDGAYAEFAEGYDGGAALIDGRENVVMIRTLSKIYGLGGLRVGWGYGPAHIIDTLNRIRGPFNLGAAQLAAAEAAVRDREFVEQCRSENARMRAWLSEALTEVGVSSDHSSANFILARFASVSEADAYEAGLREDGILVRKVAGYKLPECLRITVGTEADCRRVVASLRRCKEGAV